jgi:molybdopterin-guanine dinucleotide biosynthesis protein B
MARRHRVRDTQPTTVMNLEMRVFGFAGWSGSGKTTLIERLVPELIARGIVVSLVKHAHHEFDVDQPGKDSWRHRHAGCTEVLVSSSARYALMHELRGAPELTLAQALGRLSPCDLVLVEGYKAAPIPKLEVWRASVGKPLLHPTDPCIVGIATDAPEELAGRLPVFLLDDADALATFVLERAAFHPLFD